MDKNVKILLLTNNQMLISQIEEISSDLGEPDCKLTEPFVINDDGTLSPWMIEYTSQNVYMISSEKIVTIVDPKPTLLEKYQQLIK